MSLKIQKNESNICVGGLEIKKENCYFCGHRWVRCSDDSPIVCPNCKTKFYSQEQLEKMKKTKK